MCWFVVPPALPPKGGGALVPRINELADTVSPSISREFRCLKNTGTIRQ
jgi:hypothetical protein